ncbi:hypothetical protein GCM10009647_035240 [Streptomyces sanglieri]
MRQQWVHGDIARIRDGPMIIFTGRAGREHAVVRAALTPCVLTRHRGGRAYAAAP